MDRRSMLALCGAATTALAGCGGSPGTDGTTRPATATTRDTGTAGGAAPLSVRSVDAPVSVEIGQSYPVRFAVENPTDGERTLDTAVSVRTGGEWHPFASISAGVPPGTTTVERELAAPLFLGTYRFRLDDPTAEWRIEASERRLAFGESFGTPQGLTLSVLGGEFADAYDAGGNETVTPPADRQFLLVRARVRNPTDESTILPPLGVFHVDAGGETYDVALDDPGQRVTVDPGNRTEIELPFVVPTSVSVDDLAVRWAPEFRPGRTVAVWTRD